jgi:NDP-sugar pyrophosphorylase family protein
MRAMVLCAGYGMRLGDLTHEVPKPMLLLEGRPLLEHIIANLSRQGFREIGVNLHFLPGCITSYFGDGSRWNVQIRYSHEPQLLGTAGALAKMADFLAQENCFLVHYGDVLTNQDFSPMIELHRSRKAKVTLLVHERKGSNSVVDMDAEGRVVGFLERPSDEARRRSDSSWVNSGVSYCSSEVLQVIPTGFPSDIPRDILPKLVSEGRVYGFPLSGYRCAIDSPERLEQARAAVRAGMLSGGPPGGGSA